MKHWLSAILGFTLAATLEAGESFDELRLQESSSVANPPWFTGPLLTPSGHTVPTGHQNCEPYIYWTQTTGTYDGHWKAHSIKNVNSLLTQFTIQLGALPYTEVDFAPQFVYNDTQGKHMWRVSDLPVTLAFQILKDAPGKWYPAIKLRLAANIPLGKYDRLNREKLGTDVGGNGNWEPQVGLVFTNLHHVTSDQYFSWRLFLNYCFPTKMDVRGLNIHGGVPAIGNIPGTRGKVHPGHIFLFLYGAEYSLTKNWVLALDVMYQHNNKRTFKGYSPAGTAPKGPSKELFALAPAIEYNWNANIGIIAGPWFSIAGRNSQRFMSYVVAFNVYK